MLAMYCLTSGGINTLDSREMAWAVSFPGLSMLEGGGVGVVGGGIG
jgi:hypothetical protein